MVLSPVNNAQTRVLCLDRIDLDGCKELTMSLFTAIAFAALELENDNFAAFSLLDNMASDKGAFQQGLADTNGLAIGEHQHLIECHFGADFPPSFSTRRISPASTLYCLPPVATTAYIAKPP
jgi:hypothetical protein